MGNMREHSWIFKALAQKAIYGCGLLDLYHELQTRVGRLQNFHPKDRIEYAAKLATDISEFKSIEGATILEIGTGWVPVLPLALYMMGASRVITFDLNRHLNPLLTMYATSMMRDCLPEIERRTGRDTAIMKARLDLLLSSGNMGELFHRAGIEYHAPADAGNTGLEPESVDIAYSNLVLEHVTPSALHAIHAELKDVLREDGVIWHNVDFSDHYAATQRHLSPINFLRYSEPVWNMFGQNEILYQNRWRCCQYQELFDRAGFKILGEQDHRSEAAAAALKNGQPVHRDFTNMSRSDLTITSARFVLAHQ
jgi:hypothetical protein